MRSESSQFDDPMMGQHIMNLDLYVSSDSEPRDHTVQDNNDEFKAGELMNVEGNNVVFGSDNEQNDPVIQGRTEVVKGKKEEAGVF